jgi:peptidoglycan/LPS O-acetylase OafA/YrhL
MLRRTDVIGFAGLGMLVAGAVLFLTGSEGELTWVYWMTGTCIWFAGFGVLLGWLIWRAGTFSERPAAKPAGGRKQ